MSRNDVGVVHSRFTVTTVLFRLRQERSDADRIVPYSFVLNTGLLSLLCLRTFGELLRKSCGHWRRRLVRKCNVDCNAWIAVWTGRDKTDEALVAPWRLPRDGHHGTPSSKLLNIVSFHFITRPLSPTHPTLFPSTLHTPWPISW